MNVKLSKPVHQSSGQCDQCSIVPAAVTKVEVQADPDARSDQEPRRIYTYPGGGGTCAGNVELVAELEGRDKGA